MPQLTLFKHNGACSAAAHMLLKELDIPFKAVEMNPGADGLEAADGSLSNAEYKQRYHHMGYIPALEADGHMITENPAILSYIADLVPQRQMMGSTQMERAECLEWLSWLAGTLHGYGYGALWRPKRYSDDESQYPGIQEKGKKTILASYERIEKVLDDVHAVGGRLTAVDFYLHVFYRWGNGIGVDMSAKYPKYAKLIRNLERLESAREALKDEKVDLQFPQ